MKITEQDLFEAAPRAAEIWMEGFSHQEDTEEHVFSKRFEKKMNRLIRDQKRTPRRRRFIRAAKVISGTAAAVLVFVMFAFLVPVNAQKEHFVDVIAKYFDGEATYTYSGEDEAGEFGTVTIGYVPERMKEVSRTYDEILQELLVDYGDSEGHILKITISMMPANKASTVEYDTNDSTIKTVDVNGYDATLIIDEKDGFAILFWIEGSYVISIIGDITEEEVIRVAQDIKIIK